MDCRAISLFFRQSLARGAAIRSGGGVRIRIEELISLISCFESPCRRTKTFCSKFSASAELMQEYNFDGVFIDAAGMVAALLACIGVEVSLADWLIDLGPEDVACASDDDSPDPQVVPEPAPPTDDAFRMQLLNADARPFSKYTSLSHDSLIKALED